MNEPPSQPATASSPAPATPLAAEAAAFNERLSERERAGFIPDLRRAVKCDYFYKSFWRDPHFINLYLMENVRVFLEWLQIHGRPGLSLLDVGCGPGYISLELARAGYHVVGLDIAERAIDAARRTLAANPYRDRFGSLEYRVGSLDQATGSYDAILFSGSLHHFADPAAALQQALARLRPRGWILCHEPCHEAWREADAAQVALIRALLALSGAWYERDLGHPVTRAEGFAAYVREVHTEYVLEQDPGERGQSPNDNASTGQQILAALDAQLDRVDYRAGSAFIYRTLGGLRGPDSLIHPLADLLAAFERYSVEREFLRPNHFFYLGRKR